MNTNSLPEDSLAKTLSALSPIRPVNKRGVARLFAVQALYQMEMGFQTLEEIQDGFEEWVQEILKNEAEGGADKAWFNLLLKGVHQNQGEIDHALQAALNVKPVHQGMPPLTPETLAPLLRALLRVAGFELLLRHDVPARVILAEYIRIGLIFYSQEKVRFLNAVLHHLAQEFRQEEIERDPSYGEKKGKKGEPTN